MRPYQPAKYYAALNFPERDYKPSTGEDQFRRAVYVHWQRQYFLPFLLAFDAPIARGMHRPAADFQHADAALVLAERSVVRGSGPGSGGEESLRACTERRRQRIHWAWKQVLGREPEPAEANVLASCSHKHRAAIHRERESCRGDSPSAFRRNRRIWMRRSWQLGLPSAACC